MSDVRLLHGDCLDRMAEIEAGSVDAIVTDPPAGIGFMGAAWDKFDSGRSKGHRASKESLAGHGFTDGCERLVTPKIGGHNVNPTCRKCGLRARTWQGGPMACSCEIPDLDLKRGGTTARDAFIAFLTEVMAQCYRIAKPGARALVWAIPRTSHWTATAIEDAGWIIEDRVSHLFGSGFPKHASKLKPAMEDWWMAWKPDRKATPLNIDACRIGDGEGSRERVGEPSQETRYTERGGVTFAPKPGIRGGSPSGRWPAHLTHDGSPEVMEAFAAFSVHGAGHPRDAKDGTHSGDRSPGWGNMGAAAMRYGDTGSAARFFYAAKASKSDRGDGNTHPTVKSHNLMRWLVRLIAKPGELVADPFMGSGSTGVACMAEGVRFVGIEQSAEYLSIAENRLAVAQSALPLFAREVPA